MKLRFLAHSLLALPRCVSNADQGDPERDRDREADALGGRERGGSKKAYVYMLCYYILVNGEGVVRAREHTSHPHKDRMADRRGLGNGVRVGHTCQHGSVAAWPSDRRQAEMLTNEPINR